MYYLKDLYLGACEKLGSLPEGFGELEHLKQLYMGCCPAKHNMSAALDAAQGTGLSVGNLSWTLGGSIRTAKVTAKCDGSSEL